MWRIYRHYSGKHYLHLGTAAYSESLEPLEVYRSLYDNPVSQMWVRPREMFHETREDGIRRFTQVGLVRRGYGDELVEAASFGFDAWGKGQSFDEYVSAYVAERDFSRGVWFVLEAPDGERVAVVNTLRFAPGLIGLASLATKPSERGKGHGSLLTRAVMEVLRVEDSSARFALFSEVSPAVYERFGFRVLPDTMQHFKPALAMITGESELGPREERVLREYF